MSSFDISLRNAVPLAMRPMAVNSLWSQQPCQFAFSSGNPNFKSYFDLYFRYYTQQCDLIGRHASGKYSSVESHRDIMNIAQLLQQPFLRGEVRKHMADFLKSAEKQQHDNSINLVVRLLLMIKVGYVPHEFVGGTYIEWNHGDLREFVHNHFAPAPNRSHDRLKLEKSFTAVNVQRIAGIKIWWTDNLADHLRMMDDDKAVFIFHYASFLEHQKHNSIYPPHLIEETLQTIALLFPRFDPVTKKWYQKAVAKSNNGLDLRLIGIGNLNTEKRQIENFRYWRDRLVILKEVYDDARPDTLSQWWHDRRNGSQWYPFWIALWVAVLTILTIIIGVVQCVESGLQVYLAELALKPL